MWKSILKWVGKTLATEALNKVTPPVPAPPAPVKRRRSREEMKAEYWAAWNYLMSKPELTKSDEARLERIEDWLNRHDHAAYVQAGRIEE